MKLYPILLLVITLSACSTLDPKPNEQTGHPETIPQPIPETIAAPKDTPAEKTYLEKLMVRHEEWRGTKYRMGSLVRKNGVDCSGFVLLTFRDLFGVELPRSTRDQNLLGTDVKRDQLQAGDLVFFHTGRNKHVGIYLENDQFLHASTKAGVKISKLSETYWKKNYWKAKRLDINNLAKAGPIQQM